MKKEILNEVEKKFNLNECVIMRSCYDRTEANMAIRRSVKAFINPINKAMKEATDAYNKVAEKYLDGKDIKTLSEKELSELSTKMNVEIFKINSSIYPKIDLAKPSSLNFFVRFWTQFSFNHQVDGDFVIRQADEIDAKIIEVYPELDIDMDKEEDEEKKTEEVKK